MFKRFDPRAYLSQVANSASSANPSEAASRISGISRVKPPSKEPPDTIQPWNFALIDDALRSGQVVWIWSRVLDGRCVWVRDDAMKTVASRRFPNTPVFTLVELEILVELKCSPDQLRAIANVRTVFGNDCSIGMQRLKKKTKENQ